VLIESELIEIMYFLKYLTFNGIYLPHLYCIQIFDMNSIGID